MTQPRPTPHALDAESAAVPPNKTTNPIRRIPPMPLPGTEVLGNIKRSLSLSNRALL